MTIESGKPIDMSLQRNQELTEVTDIPIIDLDAYLANPTENVEQCKKVAESLHKYGILIVKDSRADQKDNSDYIDLMEKYFAYNGEKKYAGQQIDDAKPDCHYQVGVTPDYIEMAREHKRVMAQLEGDNKPISPEDPIFDAKWRFMWKIGQRADSASDDFPQVIPKETDLFPRWEEKMDKWGNKLLQAVYDVAEMSAIGMNIPKDTFTKRMQGGAHLLAPTGSDLNKHDVGTIFAGFHYDISFMTIHGKSRYPGLYVWLRDWRKLQVKVPEGCLLIQAGASFEHITGGYVLGGFHEVVYTDKTKEAYMKAKEQGKNTWRVSSTMFTHFSFDTDVSPLPELVHLQDQQQAKQYPKMTAFELLMQELSATNMTSTENTEAKSE